MEAEEEEEEEEKGGDVDDISFFLVVLPVTNEAHTTQRTRGVDEIQTFLLFLCVYVYTIYINHAGERKTRDEESTLFSLCVCKCVSFMSGFPSRRLFMSIEACVLCVCFLRVIIIIKASEWEKQKKFLAKNRAFFPITTGTYKVHFPID